MIAVGIDVSKSKSTVAILNSDGTPLARPFNMAHTLPEMNSFVERLRALDAPVTILMEYTGHYHYPVLKKLQAEGFPVCLINPYQMKKYGDVEIHKAKTDRKDAVRIATYALEKAYKLTPYSAMEQKYEDLRFLSRQYGQRIADVSRLKTQLLDHLDQTMPGITSLLALKSRTPDNCVLLLFIKRFNSFDEIHRIGKPRFLSAYSSLVKKTTDRYAASKALPEVFEVCILDAGEEYNIHPRHKKIVGERLSRSVLKHSYGFDEYIGDSPRALSFDKQGDTITILFSHTGKGLECKGDLKKYLLVTHQGKELDYTAEIKNNRLILKGPFHDKTVRIEFCESNYCVDPLFNSDNDPVFAFTAEV